MKITRRQTDRQTDNSSSCSCLFIVDWLGFADGIFAIVLHWLKAVRLMSRSWSCADGLRLHSNGKMFGRLLISYLWAKIIGDSGEKLKAPGNVAISISTKRTFTSNEWTHWMSQFIVYSILNDHFHLIFASFNCLTSYFLSSRVYHALTMCTNNINYRIENCEPLNHLKTFFEHYNSIAKRVTVEREHVVVVVVLQNESQFISLIS